MKRSDREEILRILIYIVFLPLIGLFFLIKAFVGICEEGKVKHFATFIILSVSFIAILIAFTICVDEAYTICLISSIVLTVFLALGIFIFIMKKIKENNIQKARNERIVYYIDNQELENDYKEIEENQIPENNYIKKDNFISQCEMEFLDVFKSILDDKYIIQPQINLGAVIDKETFSYKNYRNELFRNIDFGVFDKNYKLLFLIEINDSTHENYERKKRDKKVKEICEAANIPLLTFWTSYGVNEEYIRRRFSELIEI